MKNVFAFLLIGISILLLDFLFNYSEDEFNIFISDQEIESLIQAWEVQVGRPPEENEIIGLINDLIREEILYREALRLNLDNEDRIIKRRLAQKITFLREESSIAPPSKEELEFFYKDNIERYLLPQKFSFTHYYFAKEKDSEERASQALEMAKEGKSPESDPYMLGKNFVEKSRKEIERSFGSEFISIFKEPNLDTWIGPVKSIYGHHLVKFLKITPERTPELNEIKEKVEIDYYLQGKQLSLEKYLDELRSKYKIIINPTYNFYD
tara:strand:+ start:153 stop:953 length:801 start_codon:yes stop_codon:yes gene_type:complete